MENYTIKNKTKSLMRDFVHFTQMGGEYYSSSCEIKAISILICTELANDNRTKILKANIQWCYSTNTTQASEFEYSENGFIQACNWLDKKRLEYIGELL